jgi:hypothetical protein
MFNIRKNMIMILEVLLNDRRWEGMDLSMRKCLSCIFSLRVFYFFVAGNLTGGGFSFRIKTILKFDLNQCKITLIMHTNHASSNIMIIFFFFFLSNSLKIIRYSIDFLTSKEKSFTFLLLRQKRKENH